MNPFYDKVAAKATIEKYADYMSTNQLALKKDCCTGPADKVQVDSITVKQTGFPLAHKAVQKDATLKRREIHFTVVGMLSDKEIPPVKRGSITTKNMYYARQQAVIVGLDTPTFNKAIEKITEVACLVELAFESDEVVPWALSETNSDEDGIPLEAFCRYYTIARDAPPYVERVDFNPKTDPTGTLSTILGKGVYHCQDNEVDYLNISGDK
ncbi:hypothetical protein B0H10DRAFT_2282930 [Mycena sp. CBHHK59/15]|nr:hypothetical protein B0H10DRAFT_2282930 [Mycena sp. CBHHK59/15]